MKSTENIFVSIIVPCYNAANYLKICLDSVLGQSHTNWECLLINDGSTDESLHLLNSYGARDKRFKVFSQHNKGLSTTRNFGINNADGDYLFFLDADDYLSEQTLEILTDGLEDNTDVICGLTVRVGSDFSKGSPSYLQHPQEGNITFTNDRADLLIRTIEKGLAPVAQNRLYNRLFLVDNGLKFREGLLHEDELWFFETMYYGRNIKYIAKETYFYRTDNMDSITNNLGVKNLESYGIILTFLFANYYLNNSDTYRQAVVARYLQYFKKLIIDFAVRKKAVLTEEAIADLETVFKSVPTSEDQFKILSTSNEIYYRSLNKLSQRNFEDIEAYFFRNPINSLRKFAKLLQFKISQ